MQYLWTHQNEGHEERLAFNQVYNKRPTFTVQHVYYGPRQPTFPHRYFSPNKKAFFPKQVFYFYLRTLVFFHC